MGIFQNKFFSIAGQKERLKNVVNVIKAPFTGGKVVANTKSKTLNTILQAGANHPLATAFVGGTVANIPKAVKVAKAASAARTAAKGGVIQKNVSKAVNKASNPGLLDLNELGSTRPAPAPSPASGGLLQKSIPSASVAGVSATHRKSTYRKRRGTSRPRKSRRRRNARRTKRYGTARQYARKGGKSVKYTKNGQPYIILNDGRARFVKGRRRR